MKEDKKSCYNCLHEYHCKNSGGEVCEDWKPEPGRRCCGNCGWWSEFGGVCCNGDSDERADITDRKHVCGGWKRRDENREVIR